MTLQNKITARDILGDEDFRFVNISQSAQTVINEFETRTDEDFIGFTARPNRSYTVRIDGQGDTDTVLGLYRFPGLTLLDDADDEGGERDPVLTFESGPFWTSYIFQIDLFGPLEPGDEGGDAGGGYDFTIVSNGPVQGAQPNPNGDVIGNSFQTSLLAGRDSPIEFGAIQQGDIDYFTVLLDANDEFTFNIQRTSGNVDLRAQLLDPQGNVIFTAPANGANPNVSFTYTAPTTDFYGVRVFQTPGTTGTGGYSFLFSEELLGTDAIGDTPAGATPLGGPGQPLFSSIDSPGDVDVVSVELQDGFVYNFVADGQGSLNTSMTLYDRTGQRVAVNFDGPNGPDAALEIEVSFIGGLREGTYFVEVASQGGTRGDFALSYTQTEGILDTAPAQDQEGGSRALASNLAQGDAYFGAINNPGDIDFFAVNLEADVTYLFLSDDFLGPLSLNTELQNSNGARVVRGTDFIDDDGEIFAFTPNNSGKFFYRVSNQGNTTGEYIVDLGLEVSGQAIVALIYEAALNRRADPSGLEFWIGIFEDGASLEAIAREFLRAPEFLSTVGDPNQLSDVELVTALYENVLDRPADDTGLNFWLNTLNQPNYDNDDLLVDFARSNENVTFSTYVFIDDLGFSPFVF
ncbi:MAG: DUF4214 domain-containing protein [Paracoccaceae bacterium]